MNELKDSEQPKVSDKAKRENKILKRLLAVLRETLAVLFWIYVITKVFIFDIDIFLLGKFSPGLAWLLNYKFFILIGVLAIVWLVTKNKHIVLWTLFVLFYPVIFIFWRIPLFVFKQKSLILAFALIDAIISFFKSFKFTFITASFFLVSIALVLSISNALLLWLSISLVFITLSAVYIQRLIFVIKPSGVYQVYAKVFSFFREFLTTSPTYSIDESIIAMPFDGMDAQQIEKWTTSVHAFVLYNRICLYVSKKLKTYQDSGFHIISSVMAVLMLVVFTVLSFSLVNFGLFKIDQSFYSLSIPPTFFNFFYYLSLEFQIETGP